MTDSPAADHRRGDLQLSVSAGRVRFRDEGTGPAVVLVHGWTLDLDQWQPQAPALSDAFRLIRLDRRGFGLSSGQPSLAHDVSDVRALMKHLSLRSIALVGMSQGARVAAHLAAESPDCVSCVVFDGPPSGILSAASVAEEEIPVAAYRALIRDGRIEEFRNEWRNHPLAQLHTTDAGTHELLHRMLSRYPAVDLREPESGPGLPPARIESIRAPALVVSGALDLESRIRSADALANALPRCERLIVPGAGHLPNLDYPAHYNTRLRRFLQRFAT
jgi:pimeloyl-ACP methyl ester carboxylesterase